MLLAQAESDFLRLYAEVENRTPGRGDSFSDEIEKLLELLRHMPRLGRTVGAPYRRLKMGRFQYSLIYSVEGNRVLVHTIASNYDSLETLLFRLRQR